MNAPKPAIDFWFDFSSPYSYIASEWIEALAARHGRTVRWQAVLVGVAFEAAGLKPPVAHPLKREYVLRDFQRSARFEGVPYKLPEAFPIATQSAARIFWWLQSQSPARATDWARRALRAYFARGVRLDEPAQLLALCSEADLDAEECAGVVNDPVWKQRLRQATDDAIAAGVFGVPFFKVDGEAFWGNDRKPQIERWLAQGAF